MARLVITAWGWSLTALAFFIVLAFGVYWHHPFYDCPRTNGTPIQESLPLIVAGSLWISSVVIIVCKAISYGRSKNLTEGNFLYVTIANWILCVIATANTIGFQNVIGASIATFVNGCLLVLCIIYLAIARGVGARVPLNAYFSTVGVLLAIAASWITVLW